MTSNSRISYAPPQAAAAPTLSAITPAAAVIVALTGLCMFVIRAYQGLWFQGFVDETTHLLGARLLNSGGLLYRDFVDNHGPAIYMLASTYGKFAGWANPNYARSIPILLIIIAAAAVITSPALISRTCRLCAAGLFLGLISCVWMVQGLHQVSFYPVAGALAAIVTASFVAPSCLDRPIPQSQAMVAGFAAGLLVFTGYQFLPTVAAFSVAGLCVCWIRHWYRSMAAYIIGGLAASILMLIWLTIYGDPIGYLAFHIALGQTAFRPFIDFGLHSFFGSINPSFAPKHLVQALATIGLVLCAVLLLSQTKTRRRSRALPIICSRLLCLFGIVMLNARGETTFKDGSFLIGVIALLAIVLPAICQLRPAIAASLPFLVITMLICVASTTNRANTTPVVVRGTAPPFLVGQRTNDPLAAHIRSILGPDERLLALVYQPDLYFAADRLPISGYFAYFPWDAAYARDPWFGRPHDLCVALTKNLPKLIVFDDATVWDRYKPRDYMPCVLDILLRQYRRSQDFPMLYERNDL